MVAAEATIFCFSRVEKAILRLTHGSHNEIILKWHFDIGESREEAMTNKLLERYFLFACSCCLLSYLLDFNWKCNVSY